MEAISHAGTALGVLASDGIVLAAEKKITSKLLEPTQSSEKMYMIDEHVSSPKPPGRPRGALTRPAARTGGVRGRWNHR